MDSIEVNETTEEIETVMLPSHKITITQGSDTYIYWYVKSPAISDNFDKTKDMKLVELMHAKGNEMRLGGFESFSIGGQKDYHLERKASHEFIIKRLR